MSDQAGFWPQSSHDRVVDAVSPRWDRYAYESRYGTRAMMAMDACRSAARHGDMRALTEATRRLTMALLKFPNKVYRP